MLSSSQTFPAQLNFHLGLIERCVVGLVSHADVNRGLSRTLSGAGTRDEPPRTCAWEAIVGFVWLQCTNNDCIIRGVDSSLFTYFKQFKLAMTVNVLELRERNRQ